jgi:glycosyltransferase involved in cell wall biosynthesis
MSRRRVLFVAGQLRVGGAEQQLLLLLRQLASAPGAPVDPVVAVWDSSGDQHLEAPIRELGIPVVPVAGSTSLQRLRGLCAVARQLRPDYVHCNLFFVNFPSWVAARSCGARGSMGCIQSNYWGEITDGGTVRGRLNAWRPGTQIANSESAARSARADRSPLRPKRVWVVQNAVDVDAFAPRERPAGATVRLLGIGRLVSEKRWPWVVEALAGLDRSTTPPWHLDICGEGPERPVIEAAIARCGLADRVTLLGHRSDVAEQLATSDVLVLGSHIEGTPNVVAEALSAGVPVLSTDVGDVDQLVGHGSEGFLTAPDDPSAFAKHLLELLADPPLRRSMGERGRRRMLDERAPARLLADTVGAWRAAGWDVG